MAAEIALSVPSIQVNNDVIGIVPNTYKYTTGDGEITVRAASSGGGNARSVHTQNAESMFSTVKFHLYVTPKNMQLVRDWKSSIGGNSVMHSQAGSGGADDISETFANMSVTNDPEINAAADGVLEVEMAGDKLE